eukprot:comp9159_c0_seq1/m.4320 comp9159_c0_seq1/g.4320  ORF comp9159_c0_seq1/g.4320 comp9159_c0_seq1/m.4320 type:complete len:287 (-) comp9159_c0_seq1:560-1420(-)
MPNTMPSWLASPYHMPTTAFVTKLRFLVDDSNFDEAIAWTTDGQAIVIRNVDLFVEKVLCSTFKTSNFSSFVRQLNMYGFNKVNGYTKLVNGRRPPMIFRNNFFVRDNPELMMKMKRMPLKNKDKRLGEGKEEDEKKTSQVSDETSDSRSSRSPPQASYGEGTHASKECCHDCGCHKQNKRRASDSLTLPETRVKQARDEYWQADTHTQGESYYYDRREKYYVAPETHHDTYYEKHYESYAPPSTRHYPPYELAHYYDQGYYPDSNMWKPVPDTSGQGQTTVWRPF